MAFLPGGEIAFPFREDSAVVRGKAGPFYLDKRAVTYPEFLEFMRAHRLYRRSEIPRLLADSGYLADWKGDLLPPPQANSPVTRVSWHAAKAYCAAQGKRLPSTAEWEWAAATRRKGQDTADFEKAVLEWYARPAPKIPPAAGTGTAHAQGVRDLYGVVWEWTSDYEAYGFSGLGRRGVPDSAVFCGAAGARVLPDADYAAYMRWAFRFSLKPDYTVGTLGFRCAQSARERTP